MRLRADKAGTSCSVHDRELVLELTAAIYRLYIDRTKPKSVILIQARVGKIEFNDFLFERHIPGVNSRRCAYELSAIIVRYILLLYLR